MKSAVFRVITQCGVAISYRRFGKTYRSLLQNGTHICPETPARNYQQTLHKHPEERRYQIAP